MSNTNSGMSIRCDLGFQQLCSSIRQTAECKKHALVSAVNSTPWHTHSSHSLNVLELNIPSTPLCCQGTALRPYVMVSSPIACFRHVFSESASS